MVLYTKWNTMIKNSVLVLIVWVLRWRTQINMPLSCSYTVWHRATYDMCHFVVFYFQFHCRFKFCWQKKTNKSYALNRSLIWVEREKRKTTNHIRLRVENTLEYEIERFKLILCCIIIAAHMYELSTIYRRRNHDF